MKLYTEEQVKQMIEKSRETGLTAEFLILTTLPIELPSDSLCINCDESESTHNICMDCIIKIGKENIQLPSDEEIKKTMMDFDEFDPDDVAYLGGAIWMRDKIQGGNK